MARSPLSVSLMATASPDAGGGVDGGGGDGAGGLFGGGGDPKPPEEVCGSSNPSQGPRSRPPSPSLEYRAAGALARVVQATPTGSHHWASAFGDVE